MCLYFHKFICFHLFGSTRKEWYSLFKKVVECSTGRYGTASEEGNVFLM